MRALKFSPCGSFLASGTCSSPYLVHIWDRRGRQTWLTGHNSPISFLSFSSHGKYLASTEFNHEDDKTIRLWPTNSTRLPQQSDKTLRGHHTSIIICLDFSSHDRKSLASGDYLAIKLWNVEQEVCIYTFDHLNGSIQSLFFPAADEGYTCTFVTSRGTLIRTCWNDLSGITSDIVDMPGLGEVQRSAFSHCGSLLAASPHHGYTLTLYNMRTMTVVQRLSNRKNIGMSSFLLFHPIAKRWSSTATITKSIFVKYMI